MQLTSSSARNKRSLIDLIQGVDCIHLKTVQAQLCLPSFDVAFGDVFDTTIRFDVRRQKVGQYTHDIGVYGLKRERAVGTSVPNSRNFLYDEGRAGMYLKELQ